jgi:hypothetical protein
MYDFDEFSLEARHQHVPVSLYYIPPHVLGTRKRWRKL